MTFFLPEITETPQIPAKQPPRGISSTLEGYSAAFSKSALENDANFRLARERDVLRQQALSSSIDIIGFDGLSDIWDEYNETVVKSGQKTPISRENMNEVIRDMPPRFVNKILDRARDAAESDPEAWSDVMLSDEAMEADINARLQKEHQELEEILAMMPSGRGAAEFFGGMAGISVDIKNLPFLLMGGGSGSFARVMGREAMINASAELAFMPAQFEMAERLDIPDPDISTQILMAAGFGAAFGGVMEATGRGIRYFRGRSEVTPPEGFDILSANVMVDQAEDALATGKPDALSEISQIPFKTTRTSFPDNSINPERPPLGLVSDQRIFVSPLPKVDGGPREPLSKEQIIENVEKAIDEAENADTRGRRPLTDHMRTNHKLPKNAPANAIPGENLQIDPDGFMGQELKARGITPKSAPGLFSRDRGRSDFDNMIADEMEDLFPGIIEATGTQRGANYLDRDGFIEVLARDIQGDSSYIRSRADAVSLKKDLAQLESDAISDFVRFEESGVENGLFLSQDQVEFLDPRDVDVIMDDWFERSGYGAILDDVEKQEIRAEIGKSGGDPEFLVERVLEREADFVEGKFDGPEGDQDVPFDGPGRTDGSATGEPQFVSSQTRGRSEGQGRGGSNAGQSESTDAGEQLVAPGIAPVTTRQRLETQQDAPLRGGDAQADTGLFDVAARGQADMFDDVTSTDAREVHSIVTDDLRTRIEEDGDFEVEIELPDGTTKSMTVTEALDHLDEGDKASARLSLCGKGPE